VNPEVAPTCAPSGWTESRYCDVCGAVFTQREMLYATGHWFEEGSCKICGAADVGDHSLFGGKSLTLKYTDPETGRVLSSKQIKWSIPEEYAPFASVTAAGKLTAKKVLEKVRVEIIGTITTGEERRVTVTADLSPAVTQVEILEGEETVNGKTLTMDVSEKNRTFCVQAWPLDTAQNVSWTVSDTKGAYAVYTIDGSSLTVTNPTGKAGTVTVKATVDAGAKKTATFKLTFGSFAESVEITNTEQTLTAGSSLQRLHPLPQQRRDDTGKHITAAADSHTGIAGGIYVGGMAVGDDGTMAFQQHNGLQIFRHRFRCRLAVTGLSTHTGKFARMGCQDGRGCPSAQYILMRRDDVYAVGIQHHRAFRPFQNSLDNLQYLFRLAQTGANQYGIHTMQAAHNFGDSIDAELTAGIR
jgi:hypothetical protein